MVVGGGGGGGLCWKYIIQNHADNFKGGGVHRPLQAPLLATPLGAEYVIAVMLGQAKILIASCIYSSKIPAGLHDIVYQSYNTS